MKALLVTLLLASNVYAAEKSLMMCNGSEFGISVELVQRESDAVLRVLDDSNDEENPPAEYKVRTNFKNIIAGKSDTLIGLSRDSQEFGQRNFSNSILFRLADGQKSAFAAIGGNVYSLTCLKQ